MDRDRVRATSFGAVAETYERYRPEYPTAAVEWVLEAAPGRRLLDVGAGTGKLTRAAVAAGAEVTAVEPLEAMLDQLRQAVPGVPALVGAAEQLPLPDGSVDAVIAGQAFHWFDAPRALAEMHRVLAPGGVVGLIWNVRDDSVDWVAQLMELDGGGDRLSSDEEPWEALAANAGSGGFGPVERRYVPNPLPFTLERLRGFAASTSRISTQPASEQRVVLDRMGDIVRSHPSLAGKETFTMPFVTEVARAVRRG